MPGVGWLTGTLLSIPDEGLSGGGEEVCRKTHYLQGSPPASAQGSGASVESKYSTSDCLSGGSENQFCPQLEERGVGRRPPEDGSLSSRHRGKQKKSDNPISTCPARVR